MYSRTHLLAPQFCPMKINRADRKSQVSQCLGFCTADFWSSLAYESAEQKPKHCLTPDLLSALKIKHKTSISPTCISDLRSRPTDADRILWLLFPFSVAAAAADSLRFLLGLGKSLLGATIEVDLSVFGLQEKGL